MKPSMGRKNPTVFISSTAEDLQPYREKAIFEAERAGFEVHTQEYFVASGNERPLAKCFEEVAKADVVVVIVAHRYGWVPPGQPGGDTKSITWLECEEAQRAGRGKKKLEVLAFLVGKESDEFKWPLELWEKYRLITAVERTTPELLAEVQRNVAKLEEFKAWLSTLAIRATFTNPDSLRAEVATALRDWLARHPKFAEAQPRMTSPSRLFFGTSQVASTLVGRESELRALDAAWSGPRKKNIITIVSWGGVGKTTLVSRWAAGMLAKKDEFNIQCYFDWSFYSQGPACASRATGTAKSASADLFIKEALEFLGEGDLAASSTSAWHKGERLAQIIGERRSLFILDGLEPLQDPLSGEVHDSGLRALLRGLAASNLGLCVITTRQQLPELAAWHHNTAEEWRLASLTEKAGAALLSDLGVTGSNLEKRRLSAHVKGHALTLTLLGRYFKHADRGDVSRARSVDFEKVNQSEQGGHAFRVIAAYEHWFVNNHCSTELAILKMLGSFDRPATPDCLAALCNPPIKGLTDALASLTEEDWNAALTHLGELGLAEEHPWIARPVLGFSKADAERSKLGGELGKPRLFDPAFSSLFTRHALDTHPLIREYFAKRLQKRAAEAWKSGNSRLFEHLKTAAPYWPDGVDGVQSLLQSVCHACHAGRYQEAFEDVYRCRINRERHHYLVNGLGASDTEFHLISLFFKKKWKAPAAILSPESSIYALRQVGLAFRALGELQAAIPPLESGFKLSNECLDREWAVNIARHIAQTHLLHGEIKLARNWASRSIEILDDSVNRFEAVAAHAGLAHVLHQEGKLTEAARAFENAERILSEAPPHRRYLGGLQGYRHCELLLTLERYREAIKRSGAPFERTDAALFLAAKALASTIRARVLMATNFRKSINEIRWILTEAAGVLQSSGRHEFLVAGLISYAEFHFMVNELAAAKKDLDNAQQLAEHGHMRLHLADIHLLRARLLNDKGELSKARKLIEDCGYWRRTRELERLQKEALCWPCAAKNSPST